MLNNYFTVRETANYLNRTISGFLIEEIFSQEKNKLVISLTDEIAGEKLYVEFSIEKNSQYLIIRKNFSKAKSNYANVLKEASTKKITGAGLFNDDRMIRFSLNDNSELIFTFFSGKANCFYVINQLISGAFKDKDNFRGKSIAEIIPEKNDPVLETATDMNVNVFMKNYHRKFGDIYKKEILHNLKLDGSELLDNERKKNINEEFYKLEKELELPKFLLYQSEGKVYYSLIELDQFRYAGKEEFANVNELTIEFLKKRYHAGRIESAKKSSADELSGKISAAGKKIESLRKQIEQCRDSEKYKHLGNKIIQNLELIKKGDLFFEFHDTNERIDIKLKTELTPAENAQYYFGKYKKLRDSQDILEEKLEKALKEKSKLQSELENIKESVDYKALIKNEKKSKANLSDETSRFRKFLLNEKYEVWVGKDSASNDLLTMKYSSQNDFWFHVRGAGGSHTVLKISNKKENVPKEIINKSASIAAYYSKARNSSSVPVAYCERKFVKKKKGFKQGSVVMEREKVIFVKPSLPGD